MNRPHYAWAVCLGGCLSLFTVVGLGINIYSVYQPYIIEFNQFTNAQAKKVNAYAPNALTADNLKTLFAMMRDAGLQPIPREIPILEVG